MRSLMVLLMFIGLALMNTGLVLAAAIGGVLVATACIVLFARTDRRNPHDLRIVLFLLPLSIAASAIAYTTDAAAVSLVLGMVIFIALVSRFAATGRVSLTPMFTTSSGLGVFEGEPRKTRPVYTGSG